MEVMDTTPEGCTDPDVWWRQLTDFSDWMHAFMEPYGSLYQSDCFKNPTPKQRLYKSFDHPVPGEAP